jgi:PAS domain S-box-containing protein
MFGVLRRAMDTRERAELENDFVTPDGTQKSFELLVQPVPEGLFILSLDITDRKRAEEALRKSRARFQIVLEHLHDGVIITNEHGDVLHWNDAALAMHGLSSLPEGRAATEAWTRFRFSTLAGEEIPPEQRPLTRLLRGEEFRDVELQVEQPGTPWKRVFAYSGAAIPHAEGEGLRFLTMRDVTAHKELERQFVRAQRMETIGSLASGIAHDLNNILMPIVLGATFLRRLDLDTRATRTIENIERAARRGADLVRQVLSFARETPASRTPIDLRDVFADLTAIVTSTFPKNISLSVSLPPDPARIRGDASQMLQIILNLCVNARDAMPDGGRLTISAANVPVSEDFARAKRVSPGHYVSLEIADEGTGMTREVLDRMFEPFFTTKEIGKGTGLGLFTVQEIVRNHGGFTDVFSETGSGTTFRVFLPSDTTALPPPQREPEIPNVPQGSGQLIMVVDDEASIRAVVQQMLEAFGYEVVTAEDGAQAIALYAHRHSEIALVITDIMMPVIDGPAMIATLRRMNPEVPIIATSGSSTRGWRERLQQAGVTDFLTKPYTAPSLLRTVASVLARSGTT